MERKHRVEHVLPASNPRFIQKAAESDADVLFLDLEDAVATSVKVATRQVLIDAVKTTDFRGKKVFIRPNNLRTKWAAGDYYYVMRDIGDKVDGVTLPKVVDLEDIEVVDQILTAIEQEKGWDIGRLKLEALIELPSAVIHVREIGKLIADAGRGGALIFGLVDYIAATGGRPEVQEEQFLYPIYAKQQVIQAAEAAGLHAIDGITIHIKDYEQTKRDAIESAKLGFTGKWSLHPEQIRAVLDADKEFPFPIRESVESKPPKHAVTPFPLEELARLAREEKPIIPPETLAAKKIRVRRSAFLITPDHPSTMIQQAIDSDADEIIIDGTRKWDADRLEPLRKATTNLSGKVTSLLVMIDKDFAQVMAQLLSEGFKIDSVTLQNVNGPDDIRKLENALEEIAAKFQISVGIEVRIDTLKTLTMAYPIAISSPRVEALIFAIQGHMADFYAKGALLAAAAAAGIDAIDDFTDQSDRVPEEAHHVAVMGFNGKLVRELQDIPAVNKLFSPSETQIERALEVVELYRKADIERGLGAIVYVDKARPNAQEELVDAATVKVERRILAVAEKARLFTPDQLRRYHHILSWTT